MNYECTLASLDRLMVDPHGLRQPLCNECSAPDCTNPIRDKTIYVLGIPKKMRVYAVYDVFRQVVQCKGFIGNVESSVSPNERIITQPPETINRDDKKDKPYNKKV